jgi:hypothetical protein
LVFPDRQLFLSRIYQIAAGSEGLSAVSSADCSDQSGVTYGQRPHAMENRNGDDVVSGCDFSGDFCEYGCGGRVALVVQAEHISPVIMIAYVAGKYDTGASTGGGDGEPNLIDGDGALHDVTEQNFGHISIIGYILALHTVEATCERFFPNC